METSDSVMGMDLPRRAHKAYSISERKDYVCYNGVTTSVMVCLLDLGYLLLVAPDTKKLFDENRVVRREYEHWEIVPQ